MPPLTSAELRAVDLNSEYRGVSTLQLMENAGRAVAERVEGEEVAVFAGRGGNGGDALVAARHLQDREVTLYLVGGTDFSSADAEENWEALGSCSVETEVIHDSTELPKELEADEILDGLLGTGVSGRLREPVASAVELINRSYARVVSIDAPTGVDPDTGEGEGVEPDLTLCLHAPKPGIEGETLPIGVPSAAETHAGPGDLNLAYAPRESEGHKGQHGEIGVIGGGPYTGAPALAGMAALRTGADLVHVYTPESAAPQVANYSPDLIVHPLPGKRLSPGDLPFQELEGLDACAVGPGLGDARETRNAVEELVERAPTPLVLDADALTEGLAPPENSVVTPHRGEFRRLTGEEPTRESVPSAAAELGCTILLKGPVDVVSDGERSKLCDSGHPGMAVGGTGDVLTGITTAFGANADPFRSATAAAFLNGKAGEIAGEDLGEFTASEMLERIDLTRWTGN